MQSWYTWGFLIMLVLMSVGGLVIHTYARRGRVHQSHGLTSAVRSRPLSDDEVVQVNRDIRRRANLTIMPALLGVLLLSWFMTRSISVPLWAISTAVLLLLAAVIPLVRMPEILKSLGR